MAPSSSTTTPGGGPRTRAAHRPAPPPARDRHQAVVAAEARRLERSLRAIGPMPRAQLARAVGASRWREGSFDEAVRQGLRSGRLRALPLHWLEAGGVTPR